MSEIIKIDPKELSLVADNSLNENQLKLLLKKTPQHYIRKRPAKGGGEWEYVSGGYIRKVLNLMFGWDWSFEIMEQMVLHGEAIVKGKLTCTSNGRAIVKMQFGNKDIIYKKLQQGETERTPLSIGNDLKAAATDALKKCAAELGIAADIYNKAEFKELAVETPAQIQIEDLMELYEMKKGVLTALQKTEFERILNNQEKNSYTKLNEILKAL